MKDKKFWGSEYKLHPSEDAKIYEDSVNVEKNQAVVVSMLAEIQ